MAKKKRSRIKSRGTIFSAAAQGRGVITRAHLDPFVPRSGTGGVVVRSLTGSVVPITRSRVSRSELGAGGGITLAKKRGRQKRRGRTR